MSKAQLSVRLRKIKDGQSSFKSIVFRRFAGTPQPIAPGQGSFASPVPAGWSDGIPPEQGGMPCYMSARVFTSDGLPPQEEAWSAPAKIADTADIDYCFSAADSPPPPPDTHPSQSTEYWHDTGVPEDVWMAVSKCSNGQWGEWSVSKIKGEDGEAATAYELSPSAASVVIAADGTRSPASASCKVMRRSGAECREMQAADMGAASLTLAYKKNGEAGYTTTSAGTAVSLANATALRWLLLREDPDTGDEIPIDQRDTAFVRDGEPGEPGSPGQSAWSVECDTLPAAVNRDLTTSLALAFASKLGGEAVPYGGASYPRWSMQTSINGVTPSGTIDGWIRWTYSSSATGVTVNLACSPERQDRSSTLYFNFTLDRSATETETRSIKIPLETYSDGLDPVTLRLDPPVVTYTEGTPMLADVKLWLNKGGVDSKPDTIGPVYDAAGDAVTMGSANGGVTMRYKTLTGYHAINLAILAAATLTGVYTVSVTDADGNSYSGTFTLAKAQKGDAGPQGPQGPAGLIYRVTEWAVGRGYRNDTGLLADNDVANSEDGAGVFYLDVVSTTGANGQVNGYFECLETHESSPATKPFAGMTSDSEAYAKWREGDLRRRPIYASLLMAPGAVIGFMQGNELKIFDAASSLKAGVSSAGGSQPVFYANPVRRPVRVEVSEVSSSGPSMWVSSITIANNQSLYIRFKVTGSDGVQETKTNTNCWTNDTGSAKTIDVARATLLFDATDGSETYSENAPCSSPCTTTAKPYLWAKATFATDDEIVECDWRQVAQQQSSLHPSTALYQQFESGSAQFGYPGGARIALNASPADGLPRIDIYDEQGSPSAHFDGSTITDSSQLYGTGSDSTATLSPGTRTATASGSGIVTAEDSASVSIVCASPATITIPKTTLKAWGKAGTYDSGSGSLQTQQSAQALLYLDRELLASADLVFASDEQSVAQASAATASMGEVSRAVGAGTHTLSFVARYTGYAAAAGQDAAFASASMTAVIASAAYSRLMCRYFANGLAIGSASNNYCMVWDNGGVMNFVVRNADHGLRVDSNGVHVLKSTSPESWYNLENLIP